MDIKQIAALDEQVYFHTFGARQNAAFASGSGCTLTDTEGKQYTDFFAGIAVNSLGYCYPAFQAAMHAQLDRILHTSSVFYIENQTLLAQQLVENSFADRVFFASTGAEANEGAVKLVRKFFYARQENRYEVITLNNSFHGRTLAMVAATGQEKYQKPYHPLPEGFVNVTPGDLSALEAAIGEHTAAVLLEVLQGEGGVVPFSKAYIQGVEALCRKHGILFMVDEVQTGIGRTGKLFAYEHYGVTPDVVTLAKALGNGIPISAILAREPFASAFTPGDHGTTFGGNPFSCAAGLAVMDALLNDGILSGVAAKSDYLRGGLEDLARKHPVVKQVRGLGLLLGMELDTVPVAQIVAALQKKGFVVGSAARNTLRFAPPLIISSAEMDALFAALDETLTEVSSHGSADL